MISPARLALTAILGALGLAFAGAAAAIVFALAGMDDSAFARAVFARILPVGGLVAFAALSISGARALWGAIYGPGRGELQERVESLESELSKAQGAARTLESERDSALERIADLDAETERLKDAGEKASEKAKRELSKAKSDFGAALEFVCPKCRRRSSELELSSWQEATCEGCGDSLGLGLDFHAHFQADIHGGRTLISAALLRESELKRAEARTLGWLSEEMPKGEARLLTRFGKTWAWSFQPDTDSDLSLMPEVGGFQGCQSRTLATTLPRSNKSRLASLGAGVCQHCEQVGGAEAALDGKRIFELSDPPRFLSQPVVTARI